MLTIRQYNAQSDIMYIATTGCVLALGFIIDFSYKTAWGSPQETLYQIASGHTPIFVV